MFGGSPRRHRHSWWIDATRWLASPPPRPGRFGGDLPPRGFFDPDSVSRRPRPVDHDPRAPGFSPLPLLSPEVCSWKFPCVVAHRSTLRPPHPVLSPPRPAPTWLCFRASGFVSSRTSRPPRDFARTYSAVHFPPSRCANPPRGSPTWYFCSRSPFAGKESRTRGRRAGWG